MLARRLLLHPSQQSANVLQRAAASLDLRFRQSVAVTAVRTTGHPGHPSSVNCSSRSSLQAWHPLQPLRSEAQHVLFTPQPDRGRVDRGTQPTKGVGFGAALGEFEPRAAREADCDPHCDPHWGTAAWGVWGVWGVWGSCRGSTVGLVAARFALAILPRACRCRRIAVIVDSIGSVQQQVGCEERLVECCNTRCRTRCRRT
jgi:hypothetical protein